MDKQTEIDIVKQCLADGITKPSEILKRLNLKYGDSEYKNTHKRVTKVVKRLSQPTFEQKLEEHNHLPTDNWQHGWLKTKEASIFIRNDRGTINFEEVISDLFSKHIKETEVKPKAAIEVVQSEVFDRLVIADMHIGLDPNKSGNSMYPMKWGREEIEEAKQSIINKVIEKQVGNVLYFDNLGDYLDGYEGRTTRGTHSLEQNLSTSEMFTLGVDWMMELLIEFSSIYDRIIVRNITNDNHAGNFAHICGIAIQKLIELKFDNVEFINQTKFIDHYSVGNHLFLLCHGKDKSLMKYGFGSIPNKDNIHKIENYISAHKLNIEKDIFIEFSKGDSHLYNADNGSSDIFAYISYPTLAPNSEWITTNFKKGKRGFVFYNIEMNKDNKSIHPIYL